MLKANKAKNPAPASRANRKAVVSGQHKKADRRMAHAAMRSLLSQELGEYCNA